MIAGTCFSNFNYHCHHVPFRLRNRLHEAGYCCAIGGVASQNSACVHCACRLLSIWWAEQGIEDGDEIEFEIELLSYTKHAAWVAMTPDEKLIRAEALKQQGNATLKAGQLKHARVKYLKAMRILDQTFDFEGDAQVSAWFLLAL